MIVLVDGGMVATPLAPAGRLSEESRPAIAAHGKICATNWYSRGPVRSGNRCVWISVFVRRLVPVMTDEDLAVRAQADGQYFGQLYERYSVTVYRFVRGRIGNAHAAEDVTSEVFLKALRGIGGFRQGHSFRAWLFQIAVNASIDHLRRHRFTTDVDELTDLASRQAGVDEQVILHDETARVARALAELAPDQRTAVTLRLAADLSNRDIAAAMERSEGAVKVLIHRGLATLRERLQSLDQALEQKVRA